MRPVPTFVLLLLLVALCGLCAWQWGRESKLREYALSQRDAATTLTAERDELETRVKAADGEILRLTGALSELRVTSVSKQEHDEVLAANTQMRESVEKQNLLLTQQNEAIQKQNEAIAKANESITKLAAERDDLAKRLNEVTAQYNKLANPPKPQ